MFVRSFCKIILCCGAAVPSLAAAYEGSEVAFRVDAFGARAAVVSIVGDAGLLAAALSDDGATFKVHLADGVYIDRSAFPLPPSALISAVDQLRGIRGVDLVLSLRGRPTVTAERVPQGVRYIFAANVQGDEHRHAGPPGTPSPELECSAERSKIAELQGLVRDLTLEVLSLKRNLEKASTTAAPPRGAAR
jgi:hypothetical protein